MWALYVASGPKRIPLGAKNAGGIDYAVAECWFTQRLVWGAVPTVTELHNFAKARW